MSSKEITLTSELRGDYGELFYKVYNYKKNVKIEDVSKDKEYQHKDIDFIVNGLGVEIKTDAIAQFSGNFVNEGFCQVKNYNKSLLLPSVYAFKDLEKMQTNDMFPAGFMLKTQADILFCLNVQEKFNQKNYFRLNFREIDGAKVKAHVVYEVNAKQLKEHLYKTSYNYFWVHHDDENVNNFVSLLQFENILVNKGFAKSIDEEVLSVIGSDKKLMKFLNEYHNTQEFREFIIENHPEIC